MTVLGKGQKQRVMSMPLDVIGELSKYLVSRGLDPDLEYPSNRGAYLLGQAVDVGERAPWAPDSVRDANPKAGITAGRLYKVLKAFFTAITIRRQGKSDPRIYRHS